MDFMADDDSKRHLAQEGKANSEKSEEQIKKTKSYASLKNWGHELLKARQDAEDKDEDEEQLDQQAEEGSEEVSEEDGDEPAQAGDKRKAGGGQAGANKKREVDSAAPGDEVHEEDKGAEDQSAGELGSDGAPEGGEGEGEGKGDAAGVDKGDTVSWNWGNGQPQGKVLDVKEEE